MAHLSDLAKTADELCVLHRCKAAVAFLEEASSVTPDDANFHHHLAVCYIRDCHAQGLQDPRVAIYHYRRALALMPQQMFLRVRRCSGTSETPTCWLPRLPR